VALPRVRAASDTETEVDATVDLSPVTIALQGDPAPPSAAKAGQRPHASRVAIVAAVGLFIIAIFGPMIRSDTTIRILDRLKPPVGFGGTWEHPLGTDSLGRDVLAQVIAGAHVSLLVGVGAVVLAGLIGVPLGLLAGYRGGLLDGSISWLVDFQIGFPAALLILLIASSLKPGIGPLIITLGVVSWMLFARLSRSLALSLRSSDFVAAAQLAGSGTTKILRRHLLPNMMSPIITLALLQVATAMLGEAALSYLGFGISRPQVSWGLMISEGQQYLSTAWWVVIIPGLMLSASVLVFHELSRSLRTTGGGLRGRLWRGAQ
jgi:peptide/nickel transport system permease protein